MYIINNLKNEFKKLFFTTLTETEIKLELGLTDLEYMDLLKTTKKELGFDSSYRRQPHRYGKYISTSYYLLEHNLKQDTYKIITYNPTIDLLKTQLVEYDMKKDCEYTINKASDENLSKIIEHEFYTNQKNWSSIMQELHLPYYKFYELLNKIKKRRNDNNKTTRTNRFIYYYRPTNKFVIKKVINGKQINFGYYEDKKTARKVRDFLEQNNWDINLLNEEIGV